jgi:hypothetical protein
LIQELVLEIGGHDSQGAASVTAKNPNKFPLPGITQRGLNIRQASAYWGVSPGTFKKLVRLGLAPAPLILPGCDRNIFDKVALDRAMDAARQTEAA